MDILNARDLFHEPLPARRYWVNEVVPKGGIVLIGGYTKVGKSWVMLELADALTKGRNFGEYSDFSIPEPARVLYLEREVRRWGVQNRLQLRKVEPDPKFHLVVDETRMIEEFVTDLFKTVQDYDVLIIDPVSRFLVSDIEVEKVARFFQIVEECRKAVPHLAVVIVHHFRKPDDKGWKPDPLNPYNFRGPARWIEAPDTLITLSRKVAKMPGEAWRLAARFTTRHNKEPGDPEGNMGFVLNLDFAISENDSVIASRKRSGEEESPTSEQWDQMFRRLTQQGNVGYIQEPQDD